MFGTVFRYELRYHLRRPITWLYFALFAAGSFMFMSTDAIQLAGVSGQIMRNSPWVIMRAELVVVTLGMIIIAGLVGSSILRDYQYRAHELLFTTPITRFAYLGGRFAGAFIVMVIVHFGIPIGLMAGAMMPWLDQTKLLPLDAGSYFIPFVTVVIPTVLVISATFFAVGALTRNQFAVHTQGIFFLVALLIAQTLMGDMANRSLGVMLDPLGTSAYLLMTRYWSVAQKNSLGAPLHGVLLANRMLWVALSVGIWGLTYSLFRFRSAPPSLGRKRKPVDTPAGEAAPPQAGVAGVTPTGVTRVTQSFSTATWWRQTLSTARLTFWSVVRQVPFAAIVVIGLVNLGIAAAYSDAIFGQRVWPVTYTMLEVLNGQFAIFFVVLIALYAGDAVWREREQRSDGIVDALPAPTSVSLVGKITGLVMVWSAVLLLLIVAGVLYQARHGYFRFEIPLYIAYLFGTVLPSLIQLTILAVLIHVVVNQKYVGHALVILFFVLRGSLPRFGLEHPIFQYAKAGPLRYSDMNGFGPFVPGLFWNALFWSGVAGLLGVLAYLAWVRGSDASWATRRQNASRRWRGPVKWVTVVFLLVVAGAGLVLVRNARVNHWRTAAETRHRGAEYERRFRSLEHLATPRMVDAAVRADLVPEHTRFTVSGTFTYVNEQSVPIDSILVMLPSHEDLRIDTVTWSRPATVLVDDSVSRVRVFRIDQGLPPQDSISLRYRAHYEARGFPIIDVDTAVAAIPIRQAIAANGAFVNYSYFPYLGYLSMRELDSDADRKKEGLPPKRRLPPIDDAPSRMFTYLQANQDWITFRATVSTAPDQIAVAPGYLEREYEENGRRVFEYQAHEPMLAFWAFQSARYEVKRDKWNDVAIEIYYHQDHQYNLDRMMEAVKGSLEEFSTRFGPYQFKQFRILEFPRYSQFAQAFPNTIPFSENIGFILRAGTNSADIDTPFYVTSHELAHQWWFHQVVGGYVQGATILSESLANYSAILLMEKTFGKDNIRKFLQQQLDQYLVGRGREAKAELPLMLVEDQPYIHYNKGSVALYALRDLIGDDAMNRALSRFVKDKAFQRPPFPISRDLLAYLEAETPDSVRYAIDDLFRTITLWDDEVEDATATKRDDGKYEVAIRVKALKTRSDSLGNETRVQVNDLMDIGVFGGDAPGFALGRPLYLEKHWIRSSDTTIRVVVDGLPRKAGIDPYNKLIDRNPRDNVLDVKAP
ncbi:MAG TPA: M1 family aminopeptidase [Gemmatimonadales bacterium]|nr:M1 family aminopeptidase [Gemmatimonadales bacterium]